MHLYVRSNCDCSDPRHLHLKLVEFYFISTSSLSRPYSITLRFQCEMSLTNSCLNTLVTAVSAGLEGCGAFGGAWLKERRHWAKAQGFIAGLHFPYPSTRLCCPVSYTEPSQPSWLALTTTVTSTYKLSPEMLHPPLAAFVRYSAPAASS